MFKIILALASLVSVYAQTGSVFSGPGKLNGPVSAAPTVPGLIVTSNSAQSGQVTTTTMAVTLGSTPTVNNTIVVGAYQFSSSVITCTDNASPPNTYAAGTPSPINNGTAFEYVFTAYVTHTIASFTITCTGTNSDQKGMGAVEVSGPPSSSNQDGNVVGAHVTSTASCTAGSITTTNQPDLLIIFNLTTSVATTISAESGWTLIPGLATTGGSAVGGAYTLTSSTGSLSTQIAFSGSVNSNCVAVALK